MISWSKLNDADLPFIFCGVEGFYTVVDHGITFTTGHVNTSVHNGDTMTAAGQPQRQHRQPLLQCNVHTLSTRIHSSRMRTARSLTVSRSICQGACVPCMPPAMRASPPCMPPAMHAPLPHTTPCHA